MEVLKMPKAIRLYVRYVDAVNRAVGKLAMYAIFAALAGLLLFAALSRGVFGVSYIWAVEMAQFLMAAYYLLGGGYTLLQDAHVRMDVLYTRWSPKRRAVTDSLTSICLIFYLIVLFIGALSSTDYALQYGQKSYTPWAPPLAPVKIVMAVGILLMLLQAFAMFFRDLAAARGKPIE
jgi:TRAP-type mannitol/chloroaromatic compound transport system permease small subunit